MQAEASCIEWQEKNKTKKNIFLRRKLSSHDKYEAKIVGGPLVFYGNFVNFAWSGYYFI